MDILGTVAYEGYVQIPIQTSDGMYVNQSKHFLPLAKETKVWQRRSTEKNKPSSGQGCHMKNY